MSSAKLKKVINSKVYKRLRRIVIAKRTGKCSYCSPHGGENITYRKHGTKKPKYKNKTRFFINFCED